MPARWRCLPLLATFCSLRWGELAALTRRDVVVEVDADGALVGGWVHVRNALVELVDGSLVIGEPKTAAGPDVYDHLRTFVAAGKAAPVFTGPKGALLRRSNFQAHWRKALESAGVEGVHFHDLRHTGNTLTAQAGATLADLMGRMGHASPRAALIYLHTTSTRDRAVAAALDVLVQRDRARDGHAGADQARGTTKPQVR